MFLIYYYTKYFASKCDAGWVTHPFCSSGAAFVSFFSVRSRPAVGQPTSAFACGLLPVCSMALGLRAFALSWCPERSEGPLHSEGDPSTLDCCDWGDTHVPVQQYRAHNRNKSTWFGCHTPHNASLDHPAPQVGHAFPSLCAGRKARPSSIWRTTHAVNWSLCTPTNWTSPSAGTRVYSRL